MTTDNDSDKLARTLAEIQKELQDLKREVRESNREEKATNKESNDDVTLMAALLPLFGMSSLGFAGPLLLPFGLRLGAARALMLHRALQRAAKISTAFAKVDGETTKTSDPVAQMFSEIFTRDEKDRKKLVDFMRSVWRDK